MVNKYRQHAIKWVFEHDSLKLMLILCYQIDELLKIIRRTIHYPVVCGLAISIIGQFMLCLPTMINLVL